ncbi:hypothetical protein [Alkalimarinus alittae]|uniref:Uncharacterized protein n=1 Tax=Alkalimarinus alittae TaxID=2961619 RepID=A0ABY6MZK9_9ALTE|nr:hypothetical protein [Alkalimarinus alittae]UZE95264.1 hypothetical protein NKI27_14500 [Alkalimarinus alittae]
MIVKIFALLLAVNLFSVMANAEASEPRHLGQIEYYSNLTGDDEILIEKGLSKSDCLLRIASMLGSQWFNDSIELKRLKNASDESITSSYPYSFKEAIAQANYGLDMGSDELSISMKIKF